MANEMNNNYHNMFALVCFYLLASNAKATDTLSQGDHNFNSSASLSSKNGLYTLGFENLTQSWDSTERWYLTLRYKGDYSFYAVWVANRAEPIPNNSGVLVIDETGKLIIRYGDNRVIRLYSNLSRSKVAAILRDDGNFVLVEINSGETTEQILWQSFDNPTDSFLPGMKLGINLKTGQNRLLTSWLTEFVPARGAFTLEWDRVKRELILSLREEIFWTSGVLSNNSFANLVFLPGQYDYFFDAVSDDEGEYLTYKIVRNQYSPQNWMNFTSLRLRHDGGMMDLRRSMFKPFSELCDGNSIDSGCCRWRETKCRRHGDKFQKKKIVNDGYTARVTNSNRNASLSLSDCKDICWNDCSCVGVRANAYFPDGTGCVFFNGSYVETENGKDGEDFYMIIPAPSGNNWKWILIAVAAILIMILLGILVYLRWRRLRMQEMFLRDLLRLDNPNGAEELESDGNEGRNLKIYSVSSIMDATNSFSAENKLGEGGFGPVYKGLLPDGRQIAIKRLSGRSGQGLLEFKNELILIAKLQHTNLVRLLGFCVHREEEKMLIYEYMPNKSLDSFIFDQQKRGMLDWNKCSSIIEGIAQGLLYLHKYSRLRIIHRDLKASNILLDQNLNPKISDFGMARIFTTQSVANTNRIVGTYGYMSPEYAMDGIFSEKSDVYSFGVLVLEIVSGRKNNSFFDQDRPLNLVGYAWQFWREGAAFDLMHPTLRDSCSKDQVLRCINVALLCVEENPFDRPTMSVVVSMLTNEVVQLPTPKQPAFSFVRSIVGVNSTESRAEAYSINNLTVTEMDGR